MIALGAAATLLAVGALRRGVAHAEEDEDRPQATETVKLPPQAAAGTIPTFGPPGDAQPPPLPPIPMMPNRNKDAFLDFDRPSPYELSNRAAGDAKAFARKKEVSPFFGPETGAVENVHVRDTTSIRGLETQTFQPSQEMRNVSPVQRDTIGPGLQTPATELAGRDGFHYGMVRMKPNDVHTHQREQKGMVVPGKALINKRTTEPTVRSLKPDRFFEVSEAYTTAAPGRAAMTAATTRTMPTPEFTNRAQSAPHLGGPMVASDVVATQDRTAAHAFADYSQRGQPTPDFGHPSQAGQAGYALTQPTIAARENQRTLTQPSVGEFLPVGNPGQSRFLPTHEDAARATLRATDAEPAYANVAPQAPGMPQRPREDEARTTARQLTQNGEYVGPAQASTVTPSSGQQMTVDALVQSSQSTLREMTHAPYTGGANSIAKAAPSYADILRSEGYSQRTNEETNYFTPAMGANLMLGKADTNVELKEAPPNAARPAGFDATPASNLYVRNEKLDSNPNRVLAEPGRLDTNVLVDNNLSLDPSVQRALPPSTDLIQSAPDAPERPRAL